MILIPLLCSFYLLSILYATLHSRTRAGFYSIVLLTAEAVLIAELTSLFTAYEIVTVSLIWGLLLACLVVCQYRRNGHILPQLGKVFGRIEELSPKERILLVLMLGTVLFAVLKMFLEPPTVPFDATVYHQPRAFMFYKNHSIHNFPTSNGHMLYFGPLNAILISQMQILCFGWDRLSPLAQFSTYLLAILGIYEASKLLCKSRTYGLIGAALTCFMPMAHLQATTMQSDLMSAGYCVAAVSMMVQIFDDVKHKHPLSKTKLMLLGLCCGLAVLGKLSAGPTLIGCALLFALFLLLKCHKRFLQSIALILCCALLMVSGFWVRNALDWNGDFLPVSYSGARPSYGEMGVKGTALLSVRALITPFADPTKEAFPLFRILEELSVWIDRTVTELLDMKISDPNISENGGIIIGYTSPTPDHVSYPLHAFMLLVLLPGALFYSLKKKKWWLTGYALCCLEALLVTSTQYLWCSSFNRYLMPGYLISFPLCVYILKKLVATRHAAKRAVSLMLVLMFGLNGVLSAYFPYKDLVAIFVEKRTPEERVLNEHCYYPLALWRQVIADVEENGYTKIGLEGSSLGDYIWMRPFADSKYQLQYINAYHHSELEKEDFIPDCLIITVDVNDVPETYSYRGTAYVRKFEPNTFTDPAISPLGFSYYVKAE